MSFENPIRKFYEGVGNINYQRPPASGAPPGFINVAGARNGLTVDASSYIVLGQDVGQVGSPGQLLNDREIPLNSFEIDYLTGGDGWMHITSEQQSLAFYRGTTGLQPITIFTKQGLAPAPGSHFGNFQIGWLEESFVNPDGQIDAVMTIGYNTNGSDGKLNPDEASFATVLESHFQQNGIGNGTFEWYVTSDTISGSINRHLFMVVDKINGGAVMDYTLDGNQWSTTALNGALTYASLDGSGSLKLMGLVSGLQVTTPTPATDGFLSVTVPVGSNGLVRFSEDSGTTTGHFLFRASIQAQGQNLIASFSTFWTQSFTAAGATRGWIFQNFNVDSNAESITMWNNGNFSSRYKSYFGATVAAPTAILQLAAGTATAGTAPLKLTAGVNLTTPEDGSFEFDGTNLYFTIGGTRKTVTLI